MIAMYQPSLLIVGTRGLTGIKGMLLGSVSKYCLQHSPVPVAVVRPEDKLKKSARKHLMRMNSSNSITGNTSEEDSNDEIPVAAATTSPIPDRKFSKLSLKDTWQRKTRRSRSSSPS